MKTLSGTAKPIILVGITVLAAVTVLTRAQTAKPTPSPSATPTADKDFVLNINVEHEYATDEPSLDAALDKVYKNGGVYRIKIKERNGIEHWKESPKLTLKTQNVMTSKLVESGSYGELTAIGAHVTQRVQSNNVADIKAVLEQLK